MINLKYFFWKNKKLIYKVAGFIFLLFVMMVCYGFTYYNYILPASQRTEIAANVDTLEVEENMELYIENDKETFQTFTGDKYGISAIRIKMDVLDNSCKGKITFRLVDEVDNTIVCEWGKKISKVDQDGIVTLKLKKQIKDSSDRNFRLYVDCSEIVDKEVAIFVSKEDSFANGVLIVDDNQMVGDMLFAVVPSKINNHFILNYFKFVIVLLFIAIVVIWYMIFVRHRYQMEHIFLVFTIIYGFAYLLVMPAFSAPDELAHYATSYRLSNIIMGVDGDSDENYVLCRDEDTLKRELNFTTTLETYRYIRLSLFTENDNDKNTVFTGAYVLKNTPIICHLSQATGITVARLLNMSDVALCFLGQFCAFIFYIVLTFVAIKIIPVGKQMLFAISSFPMVMSIVPSFSYDPIIYGLSFVLIAIIMRLIYEVDRVTLMDCIICFITSLLLAPCKMVYSFISLLIILIPNKKFKNNAVANMFKIITIFASLIYAFISNASSIADSSSGVNMIEWAGTQGFTIADILNDIPGTINMYLMTIHENMGYYLNTMIGGELSWFNIVIPMDITVLSLIILMLALKEESVKRVNDLHKVIYVGIFLLIAVLICTSLLLGWTPVNSQTILGVQGRYFLPILPLLLVPFVDATKEQQERARKWVIMGACIVNYLVILRVFEINVRR